MDLSFIVKNYHFKSDWHNFSAEDNKYKIDIVEKYQISTRVIQNVQLCLFFLNEA